MYFRLGLLYASRTKVREPLQEIFAPMSDKLAPRTSLRPQTPQEVKDRRTSEAFGDVEFRYSIDPYLRDNALARLGYDLGGDALYMGRRSGGAMGPTAAYSGSSLTEAENLMKGSLLREYNDKFPEREGMVDPNTVFYDDQYGSSPMALGHEYAHLGYGELERLGLLPEERYWFMFDPEETIIEVGDLPHADYMSNLPSRLRAGGADQRRHGDSIQFYEGDYSRLTTEDGRARARDVFEKSQEAAQLELERRGSPPRTANTPPDVPEERGIMSMIRSLFGG